MGLCQIIVSGSLERRLLQAGCPNTDVGPLNLSRQQFAILLPPVGVFMAGGSW